MERVLGGILVSPETVAAQDSIFRQRIHRLNRVVMVMTGWNPTTGRDLVVGSPWKFM